MWTSIQNNLMWRAIPLAGLVAGSVFLLTSAILSPLILDTNPALILRYTAALVLGEGILTDTDSLDLVVGVVLHYVLSILFTVVIAIVVHRWGLTVGAIGGGIMGAALYAINFYTLTVFFEWFFAISSTVLFVSHITFGITAGIVYELLDRYDTPFKLGKIEVR